MNLSYYFRNSFLPRARLFFGVGYGQPFESRTLSHIRLLLIGILVLVATNVRADEKTPCDLAKDKGADCKVVRVLTKCDLDKYKLQRRIEKLQKELKELESRKETVEIRETVVEKPVYVEKIVEKKVTKTKIKHHIISIFGHPAATSSSSSSSSSPGTTTATGKVETEYIPGLMYQYQFNFGLVPMIGIDTEKQLIFGVGFEF